MRRAGISILRQNLLIVHLLEEEFVLRLLRSEPEEEFFHTRIAAFFSEITVEPMGGFLPFHGGNKHILIAHLAGWFFGYEIVTYMQILYIWDFHVFYTLPAYPLECGDMTLLHPLEVLQKLPFVREMRGGLELVIKTYRLSFTTHRKIYDFVEFFVFHDFGLVSFRFYVSPE